MSALQSGKICNSLEAAERNKEFSSDKPLKLLTSCKEEWGSSGKAS